MKGMNNTPRTRKRKIDDPTVEKPVRQKFVEEKLAKAVPLVAKTANQTKYIEMLKTKQLVYSVGASGAGKTYVACIHAVNRFLRGEVERIVLIRPYESVGRSVGLRPGTSQEKLMPIMQSMLDPIRQVLGNGQFEYALESGQIVLEAMEDCRGRSYKKSCIIVDEASNTDMKVMQTLVTRIDTGSQMIICGDTKAWQQDIKGDSGLTFILNLIHTLRKTTPDYLDSDDYAELTNNIGIVYFDRNDVVRSGLAKLFVKAFDEI
jgi:phosphate starvation-inducible PhoH-like protein